MKKAVLSVLFCLMWGLVVYLASLPMNNFSISLSGENLYISPQAERIFAGRDAALEGVPFDDDADYSGPAVESGAYDLDPGAYTSYIYGVFECYAVFELYSPLYADSGNSAGRVFGRVEITPSESVTALAVETSEVIRGARLRLSRSGEGAISINGITGQGDIYSDTYALTALTVLAAALALLFLSRRKTELKNREYGPAAAVFCCALAALISTAPLARQSLIYGHDISFHLSRIDGIADGLRSGQFPVRLNPTFLGGYGYADPAMYPATFLYFPAILRLLGVSTIVTYQLFMLAINCLTATLSYVCFKRLFRRRDLAVFASVAYSLCLYRLICVFTRGAIGELIAMAFLPAVLLGVYEVFFGDARKSQKWLIIGFLGLANCHVLSLEIAVLFCAVFLLVNLRRMREPGRLKALGFSAAAVIALSLWIFVPMIDLMRGGMYATAYSRDIADDAVYPFELFATFVRSNGLSGDRDEAYTGMPLSVGGILAVGALLFLFLRYFMRSDNEEDLRLETLGSGSLKLSIAALFLSSTLFPWDAVSKIPYLGGFLSFVQFPWRYLGVASIFLVAVLTVSVARLCDFAKHRRLVLFICGAAVAFSCSPYLDGYMQNESQGVTLAKKYSPLSTFYIGGQEYLHSGTSKAQLELRGPTIKAEGAFIDSMEKRYLNIDFDYSGAHPGSYAELPLYYYSGYRATDSHGRDLPAADGVNGVLRVELPDSDGSVSVYYKPPASYRAAEIISLLAAAGTIVILIRSRGKVKNGKEISAAE
ncbi:MAG: hypothetical protein GX823_02360 [Clostridiales bacterium]|nr:hypothetical protein [Clostridiales bacterium]